MLVAAKASALALKTVAPAAELFSTVTISEKYFVFRGPLVDVTSEIHKPCMTLHSVEYYCSLQHTFLAFKNVEWCPADIAV